MPLQQVSEQFSELGRLKLSLPRGPFRTSVEIAEIELEEYKRTFIEKYERETQRIRSSLVHTQSKERFDREYTHPRLVINGQPVLRLFLYGIRMRTHKGAIIRFLQEQGFTGVTGNRGYGNPKHDIRDSHDGEPRHVVQTAIEIVLEQI